jgi:polygalacturonase
MKIYYFLWAAVCALLLFSTNLYAGTANPEPAWVKNAGAHHLPEKNKIFEVTAYGAINDGKTLNTKFIQNAIDDCSARGGGIVTFTPGKYLTGAIYLKQNIQLRIDKGVEILGSQNIDDYPEIPTRIAGIEMFWPSALINVLHQHKISITGSGIINAQGKPFWDKYWKMRKDYEAKSLRWIVDYDAKRPRGILVSDAEDVTISGVTIEQAGFWTVQLLYSKFITVDGLTILNNIDSHGPSTDGIDVDSSSDVLIQNCDVDCNDDNYCLKAGRDWDGLRVNRPTEYVVIRNCISRAGSGLLTIGSETSGSICHVWAMHLSAIGTKNGLNIKSAITRGGTVKDIHFQHIEMKDVGTAVAVNTNWNPAYSYSVLPAGYDTAYIPPYWKKILTKVEPALKGIPHFKDVYFSDIHVSGAKQAINVTGLPESLVTGFHFHNVSIEAKSAGSISFASNWTFDQVLITAEDGGKVNINGSTQVKL